MSLISTYQSCKTLLANKLSEKGITASANSGLTTLINKIGEIQHFTDGILLYGDKDIIQQEENLELSAIVLENGKPVNNETVYFYIKEELDDS